MEIDDIILHNCMVDSGSTNKIIPLYIVEDMELECTQYYDAGEGIYSIHSKKL
jgi:hypothetical protein